MRSSLIVIGAASCLLAGCAGGEKRPVAGPVEPAIPLVESPAPEPIRTPEPAPEISDVEAYRPGWWIGLPAQAGGRVMVAATADGADLVDARRAAVAAGRASLTSAAGGEVSEVSTDRTSAVRLSDGRYRAFVLMSGKE